MVGPLCSLSGPWDVYKLFGRRKLHEILFLRGTASFAMIHLCSVYTTYSYNFVLYAPICIIMVNRQPLMDALPKCIQVPMYIFYAHLPVNCCTWFTGRLATNRLIAFLLPVPLMVGDISNILLKNSKILLTLSCFRLVSDDFSGVTVGDRSFLHVYYSILET